MKNQKTAQEIVDFNKNALKMSFDALSSFSNQTAKAAEQLLGSVPNVPEEGKNAIDTFFKQNQKGLTSLKNSVEAGLDIDWTAKDAPVKGIEAMESFYNSAISQACTVQDETNVLFSKTSEQLPKEVKPVVEFWNQALNSNFQIFQGLVSKNFELAKKVMTDVTVETSKAAAKAATK